MSVIAGAAAVPHALNMLPAAAAVAVLCGLVIAEIAALPGVLLPGGTVTLLAGGADRRRPPPRSRSRSRLPAAVIGGDHLAYHSRLRG